MHKYLTNLAVLLGSYLLLQGQPVLAKNKDEISEFENTPEMKSVTILNTSFELPELFQKERPPVYSLGIGRLFPLQQENKDTKYLNLGINLGFSYAEKENPFPASLNEFWKVLKSSYKTEARSVSLVIGLDKGINQSKDSFFQGMSLAVGKSRIEKHYELVNELKDADSLVSDDPYQYPFPTRTTLESVHRTDYLDVYIIWNFKPLTKNNLSKLNLEIGRKFGGFYFAVGFNFSLSNPKKNKN